MRFEERYATAIRANSLKSEAKTTASSTDVLGAAGIAARDNPLGFALYRLFLGDNGSVDAIIEEMAARAVGKAYRIKPEIDWQGARILSRLVLDWYRSPACRACGRHGFQRMKNAPALSDQPCTECRGAKDRDFDAMFSLTRLSLARWLAVELEREMGLAGPAAMAALAPRLDF